MLRPREGILADSTPKLLEAPGKSLEQVFRELTLGADAEAA